MTRYQQAHKPIIEQETIEGHAVRAMYLLTAVSDLVRVDKSEDAESKRTAVERLWNNMVQKKMYLTGGIGAIKQWEGFGIDYFLPSGTDEGGCYSETCASIGVMMLAERLLQVRTSKNKLCVSTNATSLIWMASMRILWNYVSTTPSPLACQKTEANSHT